VSNGALVGLNLRFSLRATTTPGLLTPSGGDLLDDLVLDVSVGDNDTTTAITERESDLGRLLRIADLLRRKIAYNNGLLCHVELLRSERLFTEEEMYLQIEL
jgi:hypothetical protein